MSTLQRSRRSEPDGRVLRMPVASVFAPLEAPVRYQGAKGGRASAKSHYFAEKLIRRCLAAPTRAVGVRETQTSIDQSVHQLLKDKIAHYKLEGEYFKVTDNYIEGRNGSLITYKGMQNHTAVGIKSLEGADIAWVEEAQSLSKHSLTTLRPTIRKPFSQIWFSWNPNSPKDAVDNFLLVEKPTNSVVVHATYRDNPWLPPEMLEEMRHDRERDPDRYAHVWLGKYKALSEARVFRNWRQGKPEEFNPKGKTQYFGSDFGFAQDPSVLIGCYIEGRTLYVFAEAYAIGCDIDHTPFLFAGTNDEGINELNPQGLQSLPFQKRREFTGIPRCHEWVITADSSNPQLIAYLKAHGFPRMVGAIKGPNSVAEGVEFLKSYDIVVHPNCVHTIDELTSYSFKVDPKTEIILPQLEDKKNHVIDALRYAVERLRRARAGLL